MRNHTRLQSTGRQWLCILFALSFAFASGSAAAVVPGQVNYQGLLLDDLGDPVNGPVEIEFRLYPTDSGGSALWTELHAAVDVLDGVYEVALGSVTPLSPSLFETGSVYLEIEVETETLAPRQRLLAVPYALQADNANTADALGGLSSVAYTEIFEHFSFDGGDPPNDDPSEGLGDTDGDGLANFIDPDNDDDGISDSAELSQGSDINLITPQFSGSGLSPAQARVCETVSVAVTGSSFEPGVSISVGSENPTPANVTPTAFDITVGPQAAGDVPVSVTNPNGEQDSTTFSFFHVDPTITAVGVGSGFADQAHEVHIEGTNFDPSITVSFGSENPTPSNVTSTGLDVTVGPQPAGLVDVTLTNFCGEQATDNFSFGDIGPKRVFVSSVTFDGDLGGLAGADSECNQLASNAGLTGTFMAWLSDGVESPDTRFDRNGAPYRLVDDTVIAANWVDLTDGNLLAPIDVTELNGTNPGLVHSNVQSDGTSVNSDNCSAWTSAAGSSRVGDTAETNVNWTRKILAFDCTARRLYCFEQ